MTTNKNWFLRPSKIPNAPSWTVIFMFGMLYNLIVVRCLWASLICGLVILGLYTYKKLANQIL